MMVRIGEYRRRLNPTAHWGDAATGALWIKSLVSLFARRLGERGDYEVNMLHQEGQRC